MRKQSKMRPRTKWIIWGSASLALVLVIIIGYYALSIYNFANHIQADSKESRFDQFGNEQDQEAPPKWEGKEKVNILLLGGDERGLRPNEAPRSDSIMLASLDPITKKGYLFSIMRDTYVQIPGHGEDRINAALAIGGPNLAVKTVSELIGVPIQYYVYTNFEGFISLVDSIGGIDFEVEKDMKWSDSADNHIYDINLKKGFQHLDGKTALQYVRFRHDALSDFTRTERQRNFLQAVAKKMQDTSSLLKLPKILDNIAPYIETNIAVGDMIKLASLGFESRADGVVSVQIPPNELVGSANIGGASVLTVNERKLKSYVEDIMIGKTLDEAALLAKNDTSTGGKTPGSSSSSTGKASSGAKSTSSSGTKNTNSHEAAIGKEVDKPVSGGKTTEGTGKTSSGGKESTDKEGTGEKSDQVGSGGSGTDQPSGTGGGTVPDGGSGTGTGSDGSSSGGAGSAGTKPAKPGDGGTDQGSAGGNAANGNSSSGSTGTPGKNGSTGSGSGGGSTGSGSTGKTGSTGTGTTGSGTSGSGTSGSGKTGTGSTGSTGTSGSGSAGTGTSGSGSGSGGKGGSGTGTNGNAGTGGTTNPSTGSGSQGTTKGSTDNPDLYIGPV